MKLLLKIVIFIIFFQSFFCESAQQLLVQKFHRTFQDNQIKMMTTTKDYTQHKPNNTSSKQSDLPKQSSKASEEPFDFNLFDSNSTDYEIIDLRYWKEATSIKKSPISQKISNIISPLSKAIQKEKQLINIPDQCESDVSNQHTPNHPITNSQKQPQQPEKAKNVVSESNQQKLNDSIASQTRSNKRKKIYHQPQRKNYLLYLNSKKCSTKCLE